MGSLWRHKLLFFKKKKRAKAFDRTNKMKIHASGSCLRSNSFAASSGSAGADEGAGVALWHVLNLLFHVWMPGLQRSGLKGTKAILTSLQTPGLSHSSPFSWDRKLSHFCLILWCILTKILKSWFGLPIEENRWVFFLLFTSYFMTAQRGLFHGYPAWPRRDRVFHGQNPEKYCSPQRPL